MSSAKARVIKLADLGRGFPALTKALGNAFCEAASVCFATRHRNGVRMTVKGAHRATYAVAWPEVTKQMLRTHADPQDATRDGATGVAILLVREAEGITVIERSRKGTGFDYWLGNEDDDLFQAKARLEVSGILDATGDGSRVSSRVRQKKSQTKRSDALGLTAYVVVVEFGTPTTHYAVRR